jgi:hypothetical protein
LCTATSPHERLPANDVVNKLRAIRDTCILTNATTNYTTHP